MRYVVTADFGDRYTVCAEVPSYAAGRRWIVGRWGPWPPFAFVTRNVAAWARSHGLH